MDIDFKNKLNFKAGEYTLRVLLPKDVGHEYLSWFKDPEVISFIEFAQKEVKIEELVDFVKEKYNSDQALLLGIFDGQSHIGNIKFEPVDLNAHAAVMGILLGSKAHRSKGVGTLILTSACAELKRQLGISTIELGVSAGNERALNSYKKAGFSIVHESKYLSTVKGIVMRLEL